MPVDFFAPVLGWGSVTASPETFAGTLFQPDAKREANYYLNDRAFNLASLKLPYPGIPWFLAGVSPRTAFHRAQPGQFQRSRRLDGMELDITLDEGTRRTRGTTP